MKNDDWTPPEKPLRLEAKTVLVFVPDRTGSAVPAHSRTDGRRTFLPDPESGTSAGANYEEADDGSSDRDTLAKRKIVLRELKETRFRLRVLRHTGYLLPAQDPVIEENTELVNIVATLIRNTER